MGEKQSDKIAAFDTLYTTNHIQMLKILLPAVGKELSHKLAVYIKYLEFQYTLTLTRKHPSPFSLCAEENTSSVDFCELCDELLPFCSEKDRGMLNNIKNMQNTLKQFKEMEATMSMMKELFPESNTGTDGDTSGNFTGFSPDMLLNLLSPEQLELFSMFQNKED